MAVIRAGLLALCLLGAAAVALIAARLCHPAGRTAQALGRLFCRAVLRLLRVEVVVSGPLPSADGGQLLVANHVSWIDPLVLFAVAPSVVLAKHEVGTWPVIAALARLQATVMVDRGRRMQIPKVNRALAERLRSGRNVLLFPEGTTHDGASRGRFRTSHLACLAEARASAPPCAQAVALAYSDPAAAWVGDATLLPHLWTVLRRPRLTCHVAFAPPLDVPAGFDRKHLGRRLAGEVEDLLARTPPRPAAINIGSGGLIMTRA